MAEQVSTDWIRPMASPGHSVMNEPTTDEVARRGQARLFCFVFRLQNERYPEEWERTLGLALTDGSLQVASMPDADELRRVHYAAEAVVAALGIFRAGKSNTRSKMDEKTKWPAEAKQVPSVGQIVLYRVGSFDSPELRHNHTEDWYLPAVIVRVWTDTCINLKVLTDGPVDAWKTSVVSGDEPGEWSWPVHVPAK